MSRIDRQSVERMAHALARERGGQVFGEMLDEHHGIRVRVQLKPMVGEFVLSTQRLAFVGTTEAVDLVDAEIEKTLSRLRGSLLRSWLDEGAVIELFDDLGDEVERDRAERMAVRLREIAESLMRRATEPDVERIA